MRPKSELHQLHQSRTKRCKKCLLRTGSLAIAFLFCPVSGALAEGFEHSVASQGDDGDIHCLNPKPGQSISGSTVLAEIEKDSDYNALISFDYNFDPGGFQDAQIYATCSGDLLQTRIPLGQNPGKPFFLRNWDKKGKSGRAVLHLHGSPRLPDKVIESAYGLSPEACREFKIHVKAFAIQEQMCFSNIQVAAWQHYQNTHEFWVGPEEDDHNIPGGTLALPPDPDRPHNIARRDIPRKFIEINNTGEGGFDATQCNISDVNNKWPPVYNGATPLYESWNNNVEYNISPQTDIVTGSQLLPKKDDIQVPDYIKFAPVVRDAGVKYALQGRVIDSDTPQFRMCLDTTPPDPKKAGRRLKARVEITNCYANADDGSLNGWDSADQKFQKAISNIYGQCVQVNSDQTRWYFFQVYIPKASENSNALVAQWHGRPDRTLYKKKSDPGYPNSTIYTLKETDDYMSILKDKNNVFEQGGYPPIGLHLDDNKLYLWVRSDGRKFADASAKCSPTSTSKTNCINGKTDSGLQQVRVFPSNGVDSTDLTDKWLSFMIGVTWSQYTDQNPDSSGQVPGTYGIVKAALAYTTTPGSGNYETKVFVKDYEGAVGRFDNEKPYFKMGIYAPHGTPDPIRVANGMYNQAANCLQANFNQSSDTYGLCAALGEPTD